jgi:pimeloyl-ACP methyl ester carboxylesterase
VWVNKVFAFLGKFIIGVAAAIDNSEFITIADCGHILPLEKPEEFTAILQRVINHVRTQAA